MVAYTVDYLVTYCRLAAGAGARHADYEWTSLLGGVTRNG